MKKLFTLLTTLTILHTFWARSPEKMSCQAVVHNIKGELIVNRTIGMKISILQETASGPVVYAETHLPQTNENGLVSIEIGTGKIVTGIFADINRAERPFYLKTEIDPSGRTSYSITSDRHILSVPYALHAKTATTAESTNKESISGRNVELPYCADIDGNVYKTIKIDNQVWMAENLKTTRYRTSETIPNVKDDTAWAALTTEAWCDYNNLAVNGNRYGHLYNWYDVTDTRNIAPEGWHVPTDAEWTELENYLIANGGNWDGRTTGNKIGKSLAAASNWKSYGTEDFLGTDLSTNKSSGFTALPEGVRFFYGSFVGIGIDGSWWSSTELSTTHGFSRYLIYDMRTLNSDGYPKGHSFSVRCVKDYLSICTLIL